MSKAIILRSSNNNDSLLKVLRVTIERRCSYAFFSLVVFLLPRIRHRFEAVAIAVACFAFASALASSSAASDASLASSASELPSAIAVVVRAARCKREAEDKQCRRCGFHLVTKMSNDDESKHKKNSLFSSLLFIPVRSWN